MRFKMRQNPPADRRVLDAGNALHQPAAELASLEVDAKPALGPPRPAVLAEAPALAAEGDQPLDVADRAASPQETVFNPTALQVILQLPLHVGRQTPAIGSQHARLAEVKP